MTMSILTMVVEGHLRLYCKLWTKQAFSSYINHVTYRKQNMNIYALNSLANYTNQTQPHNPATQHLTFYVCSSIVTYACIWMLQVVRDVKVSAAVPQEEEGEILSLLTGHFANAQRHRRNLPFSAAKEKFLRWISVGWDNYQMLKMAKYKTQHKGRKFLTFGVTYADSHRLPSLHLDDEWVNPAGRLPQTHMITKIAEENSSILQSVVLIECVTKSDS